MRHCPSDGTLRFSLSEDTMVALSTDTDRTRWVESEAAAKTECNFQKKNRDNVNNVLHVYCLMYYIDNRWTVY